MYNNLFSDDFKTVIETVASTLKSKFPERYSNFQEKLELISSFLENSCITALIHPHSEKNLIKFLSFFNISSSSYFFVCIEFDGIDLSNRSEIFQQVREILTSTVPCLVSMPVVNRLIVFVPVNADCTGEMLREMQEKIVQQFTCAFSKTDVKMKIGVSAVYDKLEGSSEAYHSSLIALNEITEVCGTSFFNYSQNFSIVSDIEIQKYEQRILNRIIIGDCEGTKALVQMWLSLLLSRFQNLNIVRNMVFKMIIFVRKSIIDVNDESFVLRDENDIFEKLSNCFNYSDFMEFSISKFSEFAVCMSQKQNVREKPIISRVKKYIISHIGEDISLGHTAKVVGINPFYLSKLFKDETGLKFIDFVNGNRLQKAKIMLTSGDKSIKEISYACGFTDQNYFAKIFKKYYGVTPTEYKNMIVFEKG